MSKSKAKSKVRSKSKSGSAKRGSKRFPSKSSYCTKCICTSCRPNKFARKFNKAHSRKSKRFRSRTGSAKKRKSMKSKSLGK